ncbi:Post-GPI attachment to proteins factor 2-like protein [Echinococcus granulosus]|uniref:Post-GPI attachment to proteins factor 2-like protein n=1 Tax=Echinococcus granulosus TaxID=6210 RepID=W6UMM4_ECHGR|nr:Post-GPI attachment to proteins factor 2-like protein [Echinococcus granulosus]EUB54744.1 Post-GPI attachment to proteins factor 2-like protein [Echinococcus granulosus]
MEGRLGSLNFRDIAVTTLYLPFCCMIGCLSYAMFFYFDEVTESKCGVHNFVPSISGAVCMRPLLHLWRFCIVAHAVPRVFVTHLYYRAHMALADKVTLWKSYTSLVSLVYLFDLTDILSLCGLTIWKHLMTATNPADTTKKTFMKNQLLIGTKSAEFGIAFANMGFHGTAAKDFYNLKIVASLT